MTRDFSPCDFYSFRCFYKDGTLVVSKPPFVVTLRRIMTEVKKGKPLEFIYIVPLEHVVLLAPVEIELKYRGYTNKQYISNPKKCGVKVFKGIDGKIKFK